jgi:hypothetical protein
LLRSDKVFLLIVTEQKAIKTSIKRAPAEKAGVLVFSPPKASSSNVAVVAFTVVFLFLFLVRRQSLLLQPP